MIKTGDFIYLTGQNVYKELETMVRVYLTRGTPFFFDTETVGLNPRSDKFVCLQFMQEGVLPVILDMRGLDHTLIGHTLKPLFTDLLCVGMNLKFDYSFVRAHLGVKILKPFDVMLADQLIHGLGKSDGRKMGIGFDLKSIAKRYGLEVSKEERNWFVGLDEREEWSRPLPDEQLKYGAKDVSVLIPIYTKQRERLTMYDLNRVADLEMSTLPALAEAELAGVKVNVDQWRCIIQEQEQEAKRVGEDAVSIFGPAILTARAKKYDAEKAVYDEWVRERDEHLAVLKDNWDNYMDYEAYGGWGKYKLHCMGIWREQHPKPKTPKADTSLPNIGSHAQLLAAFEVLSIPATSTADDHLKELEEEYPQVRVLRRYSKLQKFVSSFGESLLAFIDPTDQRIHPDYQQIGASTGRMSCSQPNWQQIPSRDETGQRLRMCVIAEDGNKILTADYSSIEPRILGELSKDPTLLKQFADGLDIYSEMAKIVMGLPSDANVKKDYPKARKIFKTVVLGVSYGMAPFSMAELAGISQEEAEKHIEGFYTLYPKVKEWSDLQRKTIRQTGETRTRSGRRRKFDLPVKPPFIEGDDANKLARREYNQQIARIERQSLNTPIQGTSADITKLALVNLSRSCYNTGIQIKIIAVVHDEIVVECKAGDVQEVSRMLSQAMDQAAKHFLKKVYVPEPEVAVADYWTKE